MGTRIQPQVEWFQESRMPGHACSAERQRASVCGLAAALRLRFPARRAADSIPIPNRVLQNTEAGLYLANPVG